MIFNGLDLLFVLIGLIFLFLFIEGWIKYTDWSKWDRIRRRGRKNHLYYFRDSLAEDEYRAKLRQLLIPGLFASSHRTARSFDKFGEALQGLQPAVKKANEAFLNLSLIYNQKEGAKK